MGLVNKILPHYTYDDYVHWEGHWELIEGHPIAMSPLPIPEHQRVASELRTELQSPCEKLVAKIAELTILWIIKSAMIQFLVLTFL